MEDFHIKMKDEAYRKTIIEYLNRLISCHINCYGEKEVQDDLLCNINAKDYICPELTTESFDKVYMKQLDWIQMHAQLHQCSKYHCLKKRNKCRYKFPKCRFKDTEYMLDQKILVLKRNNEFLNKIENIRHNRRKELLNQ